VNQEDYVKEKVALLALMVLIFHRPSHERNISFSDIASATRLPLNQVEWLVMRALSLGLIKGSIDQVDSMVSVHWVQVDIYIYIYINNTASLPIYLYILPLFQ
jgi:26S proteasome regulatory subunit N9